MASASSLQYIRQALFTFHFITSLWTLIADLWRTAYHHRSHYDTFGFDVNEIVFLPTEASRRVTLAALEVAGGLPGSLAGGLAGYTWLEAWLEA